jgi:tRNA pseudouridine55 synthase
VIDGLAVVDKPAGWTSHDVVARCRKIFGQKRVGHSGTLDPDATGVLLVGLGRVTRLLRFLTDLPKTYEGDLVLGTSTSTLDASGEVTGTWDMGDVDLEKVRAASVNFVVDIEQVPPMVSAVNIGGKRLHELARSGVEVERPPRSVTIHRLDVDSDCKGRAGVFRLHVECSSGTYIRTLAADIGTALGGGAHLDRLRRTAIGSFALDVATPLDSLSPAHVLTPADALRDYASVTIDDEVAAAVANGKVLEREQLGASGDGPWAVLDGKGALLAMYEAHRGTTVKPAVVVAAAEGAQDRAERDEGGPNDR